MQPSFSYHRRSWCCSFVVPPHSPENYYDGGKTRHSFSSYSKNLQYYPSAAAKKSKMPQKSSHNSFLKSPQSQASTISSSKLGLRRILSSDRVSPIDESALAPKSAPISSVQILKFPLREDLDARESSNVVNEGSLRNFDVRLNLKGKNGRGSLIFELSSVVLASNSSVFSHLIADYRRSSKGLCRIEVPDVENLNVFRETIELMFKNDITVKFLNIRVHRAIDILEV